MEIKSIVLSGLVVFAVLFGGLFLMSRMNDDQGGWRPADMYSTYRASQGSSYSSVTYGSASYVGASVPALSNSNSLFRHRGVSSYAPAYHSSNTFIASSPNSPLASSPQGALYTTSSAELRSFGGGGSAGAVMGGAMRGVSSSNSAIASSPVSFATSSPSRLTASSSMASTSGVNQTMLEQQNVMSSMASASSFGYAAASSYMKAGTYDQYNAIYGGIGCSVRGRRNAPGTNVSGSNEEGVTYDSWRRWLALLGYRFGTGSDYTYSFDRGQAYDAFLIWYKATYGVDYNTPGHTPKFTFDDWLAWFSSDDGTHTYNDGTNVWTFVFSTPLGDVLPFFVLALLYMAFVALKSKRAGAALKSIFTNNKNNE